MANPGLLDAALQLASVIAGVVAERPHIDRDRAVAEAMAEVDRNFVVPLTPELRATFLLAVEAAVWAELVDQSSARQ